MSLNRVCDACERKLELRLTGAARCDFISQMVQHLSCRVRDGRQTLTRDRPPERRQAQHFIHGRQLSEKRSVSVWQHEKGLSHLHQSVPPLPVVLQVFHHTRNLRLSDCRVVAGYNKLRFALRQLQNLLVSHQICNAQLRRARLACSEEFSGPAQFEVEFRYLEAVLCSHHLIQTTISFRCNVCSGVGHQHTIGFRGTTPDASAQLVQLRQAEALRVLYHHDVCIRHIHADLDDSRGDEHVNLTCLKAPHHLFLLFCAQLAV